MTQRHEVHVGHPSGLPPEPFAHQYLMTPRLGSEARCDVHGDAEVVALAVEHGAVGSTAPDGREVRLLRRPSLDLERAGYPSARPRESQHDGVPDRLDDTPLP